MKILRFLYNLILNIITVFIFSMLVISLCYLIVSFIIFKFPDVFLTYFVLRIIIVISAVIGVVITIVDDGGLILNR